MKISEQKKICACIEYKQQKIGEAEEIRHASDYDDFYIASMEETERQIISASEVICLVESYCRERIE